MQPKNRDPSLLILDRVWGLIPHGRFCVSSARLGFEVETSGDNKEQNAADLNASKGDADDFPNIPSRAEKGGGLIRKFAAEGGWRAVRCA